jgi:hypothetical protein
VPSWKSAVTKIKVEIAPSNLLLSGWSVTILRKCCTQVQSPRTQPSREDITSSIQYSSSNTSSSAAENASSTHVLLPEIAQQHPCQCKAENNKEEKRKHASYIDYSGGHLHPSN